MPFLLKRTDIISQLALAFVVGIPKKQLKIFGKRIGYQFIIFLPPFATAAFFNISYNSTETRFPHRSVCGNTSRPQSTWLKTSSVCYNLTKITQRWRKE